MSKNETVMIIGRVKRWGGEKLDIVALSAFSLILLNDIL
jgi:hypothetical protein